MGLRLIGSLVLFGVLLSTFMLFESPDKAPGAYVGQIVMSDGLIFLKPIVEQNVIVEGVSARIDDVHASVGAVVESDENSYDVQVDVYKGLEFSDNKVNEIQVELEIESINFKGIDKPVSDICVSMAASTHCSFKSKFTPPSHIKSSIILKVNVLGRHYIFRFIR